jgi:hypothetical protein
VVVVQVEILAVLGAGGDAGKAAALEPLAGVVTDGAAVLAAEIGGALR